MVAMHSITVSILLAASTSLVAAPVGFIPGRLMRATAPVPRIALARDPLTPRLVVAAAKSKTIGRVPVPTRAAKSERNAKQAQEELQDEMTFEELLKAEGGVIRKKEQRDPAQKQERTGKQMKEAAQISPQARKQLKAIPRKNSLNKQKDVTAGKERYFKYGQKCEALIEPFLKMKYEELKFGGTDSEFKNWHSVLHGYGPEYQQWRKEYLEMLAEKEINRKKSHEGRKLSKAEVEDRAFLDWTWEAEAEINAQIAAEEERKLVAEERKQIDTAEEERGLVPLNADQAEAALYWLQQMNEEAEDEEEDEEEEKEEEDDALSQYLAKGRLSGQMMTEQGSQQSPMRKKSEELFVGIPTESLVRLLLCSGVMFLLLRFCRIASTSGQEPFLADVDS